MLDHPATPLRILLLFGLGLLPSLAAALSPEEKGLHIAREAKETDRGWGDMKATMKMVLRNQQGEESLREIRIQSLEMQGDGDKSLTIFDQPPDVKGTAFLSFSHPIGSDDQWLYLPALKRVKRIASSNKSGPFMGSEFAYEDLTSFEVEKYTYKWLRDEVYEGMDCYLIEQYPVDKDSGYTRRIAWGDKQHHRPHKVEFYDRKNSLLKTLTFHEYEVYLDKHWRPARMTMVNHQTGKSTDLLYSDYQFKTGLTEADFDQNGLKRLR